MVTKPSLLKSLSLFVTLWYIPLLFFNAGIILSDHWAYLSGWYSNYYQVRITASLIVALGLVIIHRRSWKYLAALIPLWVIHFLLMPDFLLEIRIWKAFVFSTMFVAFWLSIDAWLMPLSSRWNQIKVIMLAGVLGFQAGLMTLQLALQKSIMQPLLGPLGQPPIPTPGGAQETLLNRILPDFGQFYLPYGTVPHPNIAAGLAALFLILIWGIPVTGRATYFKWVGILSGLAIIVTSFSFTVWLWCLLAGGYLLLHRKNERPNMKLSTLITTGIAILLPALIYVADRLVFVSSLFVRNQLNLAALRESANSLLGIGWYAFIPYIMKQQVSGGLPSQYWQPVHNIWLLVLVEFGIPFGLGLFVVLGWIATKLVRVHHSQTILLILLLMWIVVLGSLDHYLITYIL